MNVNEPSGSLIVLYVCYGIIASLGVGINFNVVLATVGKWFPDRIGFSSGAMMMGFGYGMLGVMLFLLLNRITCDN